MKYTGNDVSVLMSVYKNTRLDEFCDAVRSVMSEQSMPPLELIIVIDGPISDELEQSIMLLDKRKVNVVKLPVNRGLSYALNEGLKLAKTELIARMDSDDISSSDRFEKQVNAFNLNSNLSVYGGSVLEFQKTIEDANTKRIMPESDLEIRKLLRFRSPFNHPTVMFKTQLIKENNGYLAMGNLEDYFLWARLSLIPNVEFGNSTDVFVNMRAGENLYKRRGSLAYIKSFFTFRKWMFQHNIISLSEMITGLIINTSVSFLPVKLRKTIYVLFLRQKIE